ncbi:MAG: LptF/LptG family permease [Verrucomicrobiaceae bacterium]|nr:LptF/LptG family permease [Verrucomicrobiaceae bacterium]
MSLSFRLPSGVRKYADKAGCLLESWSKEASGIVSRAAEWMEKRRDIGPWCIIVVCACVWLAQLLEYHRTDLPWYPQSGLEVPPNWKQPPFASLFYHYISPYLKLIGLLGGVVFHLVLLRAPENPRRLVIPLWLGCGFLAVWVIMADIYEQWERVTYYAIGQPYSAPAYVGKAIALAFLMLSPALAVSYYHGRTIWEKYILRNVSQPLAFCILSITVVVLIFDLQDHLGDFKQKKVPWVDVAAVYLNLLPFIFVEAVTPSLTLAVLFAMIKMNRHMEIIALMCGGLSLMRIARPVLLLAAFVCLVGTAANYHWAPTADARRQAARKGLKGTGGTVLQTNVMHFNQGARRSWFIGVVPYNLREEKMRRIEVREEDEHGRLKRGITAQTAMWWPDGTWSFYRGKELSYRDDLVDAVLDFGERQNGVQRLDKNWPETPWDIMVHSMSPNDMGVPDLAAYLKGWNVMSEAPAARHHFETELWHRFSYCLQGFFLVMLTIPLVCRPGRRDMLTASGSVLLAFVINHFALNNISHKLARSEELTPMIAAWLPHIVMGVPAVFLLWSRAYGMSLPSLPPLPKIRDLRWKDWWRLLRGRRTKPWSGRSQRASWLNELLRSL